MKSRLMSLVCIAVGMAGFGVVGAAVTPSAPQAEADNTRSGQVKDLKSLSLESRLEMVGQRQTISGFYSDKSVPLIVDDINRMKVRRRLPPGSYIQLDEPILSGIGFGDHLELQGTLVSPTAKDAKRLRGEQTFFKVGDWPGSVKVLKKAPTRSRAAVSALTTQKIAAASANYRVKVKPEASRLGTDYAVLINGGIGEADNRVSFYNDLVIDYQMLLGRGYKPANITVLNADGNGAPEGQTPCGTIPVNYAATAANMRTVFNQLAGRMKTQDTLYVLISDHGGNDVICLWNEDMSGATFGGLIGGIKRYAQMTFCFDLCFSGGLIAHVRGADRLIYAASDPNGEAFDSDLGDYGAMNFAFIAALTGITPIGDTINADANADGKISLAEVFNSVRVRIDTKRLQTPHYNDDTTPPDTIRKLPDGTDGVLGATRYF